MDEETKSLINLLAPLMKEEGFQKKGRSWYFESPETIAVLNLQMSRWPNWFFINIGVLVRALDDIAWPKENKCHVRVRVHELMPDRRTALGIFDFANKSLDHEQRLREVASAVRGYALPLLRQCQTVDGVRKAIADNPRLGFDSVRLRRFLGIAD